eukprot:TRINITY_DN5167_c0_g3_i3.p1 TRINITY_DN5167_c0_g3~~TRINITY_DN5167_c0_g3_i3.p1  ORF type:complete len:611 (+),score=128.13 TRINITY_DN5167_c0_g3_i3:43-1875(+)
MLRWLRRSLSSKVQLENPREKEATDLQIDYQETDKEFKKTKRRKSKKQRKRQSKTLRKSKDEAGEVKEKPKTSEKKRKIRKITSKQNNKAEPSQNAQDASEELDQAEEFDVQPEYPNEEPEDSATEDLDQDAEEDSEDFVGDFIFEDKEASAEEDNDFSCLSPEEIIKAQQAMIKEIAELLDISEPTSANLLRHYAWKKEYLLTKYFDDPQTVLMQTGSGVPKKKSKTDKAVLKGVGTCLICGDDFEAEKCTSLSCLHRFCDACFETFLNMKINERQVTKLSCPASGCNLFIPDDLVKKLVSEDVFKKYYSFITESYVEDNRQVTWCPAPNCGHAINADMVSGLVVTCKCGFRFCFTCHHEAHAPSTCGQVKEWIAKGQDDSETVHWIGANTKHCPRCKVPVEKNGGCNHMTCRQCNYEWCWLCIRPWKGHNDYYSCNRFEKNQKKKEKKKKKGKKLKLLKEEEERQKQKLQLERYLHYYERFVNHDNASKMEKQIREKAFARIKELTSGQSTLAEVKHIERGTNVLLQCQNVLKYSYVFAYYLPEDGKEKPLFNFLQEELEKTTEQLGEKLEASGPLHRVETVNLTKLAETKKNNLLRAVEQGLVDSVA